MKKTIYSATLAIATLMVSLLLYETVEAKTIVRYVYYGYAYQTYGRTYGSSYVSGTDRRYNSLISRNSQVSYYLNNQRSRIQKMEETKQQVESFIRRVNVLTNRYEALKGRENKLRKETYLLTSFNQVTKGVKRTQINKWRNNLRHLQQENVKELTPLAKFDKGGYFAPEELAKFLKLPLAKVERDGTKIAKAQEALQKIAIIAFDVEEDGGRIDWEHKTILTKIFPKMSNVRECLVVNGGVLGYWENGEFHPASTEECKNKDCVCEQII